MGKGGGTATTSATTGLPGFQQPYADQILQQAQQLYASGGPQFFPGSTVAGFTNPEQQAQGYVTGTAAGQLQNSSNAVQGAQNFGLGAYDVANNPYVQGAAQAAVRPVFQQLTEQVLPNLRSDFVQSGGENSTRRSLAESQATQRATQAALDATSQMYNNAYGQGLQTMLGTLQNTPNIQSSILAPATALSAVGQQQREMNQANINEAIARWNYQQNLPYQALSEYANQALRPLGGLSSTTATAPETGKPEQIAATVLALLPIIGMITQGGGLSSILNSIGGLIGGNSTGGSNG